MATKTNKYTIVKYNSFGFNSRCDYYGSSDGKTVKLVRYPKTWDGKVNEVILAKSKIPDLHITRHAYDSRLTAIENLGRYKTSIETLLPIDKVRDILNSETDCIDLTVTEKTFNKLYGLDQVAYYQYVDLLTGKIFKFDTYEEANKAKSGGCNLSNDNYVRHSSIIGILKSAVKLL